jgi:hypothetical protein
MGLPYRTDFHPALANLCKRLRYFLGGERPTQTTHQILSPAKAGLDIQTIKGGISLVPDLSRGPTYAEHNNPYINIKL